MFSHFQVVHPILDRETGILVPLGDVDALASGLLELLSDTAKCQKMGDRARELALTEFQSQQVWENRWYFYQEQLKNSGVKN